MKDSKEVDEKQANLVPISNLPLPPEVIYKITYRWDIRSLGRFSGAYRGPFFALRYLLLTRKAECLLMEVMDANPAGVQKIMNHNYPDVALYKASGIEVCGRMWKEVSPLEFAAWAGDTELVRFLLTKVSTENLREALEQLEYLQTHGSEHGAPLASFEKLFTAYRDYKSKFLTRDWPERDEAAVSDIGKAQYQLTIFGLQWLCDPEPFEPMPKFDRSPQRSCTLQNDFKLLTSPRCLSQDLGSAFFIFRYGTQPPCTLPPIPKSFEGTSEGTACIAHINLPCGTFVGLSQLYEAKKAELNEIILDLRQKIAMQKTSIL